MLYNKSLKDIPFSKSSLLEPIRDCCRCYYCGVRIVDWKSNDDPFVEHARSSPNCPFIKQCEGEGFIQAARKFAKNGDEATIKKLQFQIKPVGDAPKQSDLADLDSRLQTFKDWPADSPVSPRALAKAGFYHDPVTESSLLESARDCCRCYYCGVRIVDWKSNDDPFVVHARSSPNCPFIKQCEGEGFIQAARKFAKNGDEATIKKLQFQIKPVGDAPKQSDLADLDSRLQTFKDWPADSPVSPRALAKAGFYHDPVTESFLLESARDCCRCFYCGVRIVDWKSNDDPFVVHARSSPNCPFIKQCEGEGFIQAARKFAKNGVIYLKHADDVRPSDSLMDSHLQQAVPLLQNYWNTLYEITSQKLVLQTKSLPEPGVDQISQIKIAINIPMVVETYESEMVENPMQNASNQLLSNNEALFLIELLTIYTHKLQEMQELKDMPRLEGASGNEEEEEETSKLENLTELNQSLVEVLEKISDFHMAKLLGCSVVGPLGVIEQLEDLTKKFLGEMKEFLKQKHVPEHDGKITISYENIWCTILGLQGEPFNHLFEMDSDMQMHQSLSHYVESVIESKENLLKAKDDDYLRDMRADGLVTNLQKLGFTKGRAEVITDSIQTDLIDLQLPSYWGAKYLNFAVLYHPLLNDPSQLPYKNVKDNEWYTESVENKRERKVLDDASGKPKWPERPVQMINVTSEVGRKQVGKYLDELASDSEYRLFYHKTCLNGARSILQSGIKLGNGRKKQDFSSGDGFYLAEDFVMARGWRRKQEGFQAVVVFRVQKDLVDPAEEKGLDVSNSPKKWEEIVRLCRSDYEDAWKKKDLLEDVTFIRGQICNNPKSPDDEQTPLTFYKKRDGTEIYNPIQFCIRDEHYALRFGNIENIAGVIFYNDPALMGPR